MAIMDHTPAQLTSDQFRLLMRALVQSDYYIFEKVATHYAELSEERRDQSEEAVLDDVIVTAKVDSLSSILTRIALTDHVDLPRDGQLDFLTEATELFVPKTVAKKTTIKAAKSSANSTSMKPARKASSKRKS
jgi:ParB family chromosome partitioning protein